MSRGALKDLKVLLEFATYRDSYGVHGSDFTACRLCGGDSGAGVLRRLNWHADDCPVPRLERKYETRGQLSRAERKEQSHG